MKNILDKIREGSVLVGDGAWGTLLYSMGLDSTECPELWNITNRDRVLNVARNYVDAGANIIETNSFGGSSLKLGLYGLGERAQEINRAAAMISKEAAGENVYVFGSIGPTGKILMMGDVSEQDVYDSFATQATSLEQGGADALIIETMTALDEAKIAIKAAKENSSLPVICTFSFDKTVDGNYRTMMGVSPTDMLSELIDSGVDIMGTNCGNGLDGMIEIVKEIRKVNKSVLLMVQANAGIPEIIDGKSYFKEGPSEMAEKLSHLIEQNVNIIGGCCGTTPEHIARFAEVISLSNSRNK
ncbi:MAG: methionine synthase [Bacteroidia bacterium]|nr:MAG: methionine synthase [Bacteroidia bacterium]